MAAGLRAAEETVPFPHWPALWGCCCGQREFLAPSAGSVALFKNAALGLLLECPPSWGFCCLCWGLYCCGVGLRLGKIGQALKAIRAQRLTQVQKMSSAAACGWLGEGFSSAPPRCLCSHRCLCRSDGLGSGTSSPSLL